MIHNDGMYVYIPENCFNMSDKNVYNAYMFDQSVHQVKRNLSHTKDPFPPIPNLSVLSL